VEQLLFLEVALLPTYFGLPSSHLSTVKLTQSVCLWFACHLKRWSLFFDPFWRLQPPASCDVTEENNCEMAVVGMRRGKTLSRFIRGA